MPRPANRRAELAQIHLAAKALGLDTADKEPTSAYRAALWAVARVHSAADLDHTGRARVLQHFRDLGWKNDRPTAEKRPAVQGKQAMLRKINALLNAGHLTWAYADGMAKRMFEVDRVQWLTAQQTYKLLQALQINANRRAKKAEAASAPAAG